MRNAVLRSALVVGMLGCGSQHAAASSPPPPPPPQASTHATGQPCQMMQEMAGANIAATDTEDGIAITFTTTGDVDALRAHVRKMAEMHSAMAQRGGGGGHAGMHGHGQMMQMSAVPSRATVEDIPGGARVMLVPNDPSELPALREHVRKHVAMMQKGECPMMGQPHHEHEHEPSGGG